MTNQQPEVTFQNEKFKLCLFPDNILRCAFKTDNDIDASDLPTLQFLIDQVMAHISAKADQQNKQIYECYVEMLTTLQKIDYSEVPGLGYANIPFLKWEKTAKALHKQYDEDKHI